jgi:hypothetical protein
MTTVLDGAGEGSAKASWVLMRRSKKRTRLGPQVRGEDLRRFSQLHRGDRKNRTGIGPHPLDRAPPPAGRIALSAVPNRAHRLGERPRHVRSPGEARLHQEHARIGLGGQVLRSSGHDDHTLIHFDPSAVARIDDQGLGRRRRAPRRGLWTEKTGQVLARTLPPPGVRKAQ